MQKIIKALLPLLLFTLMVIFLLKGLHQNPTLVPSPFIGKRAPIFKGSNSLFYNHVTLFNVFASWCLYCRSEHPVLMDIAQIKWINLVGLDYKDDPQAAKKMLKKYGNPYSALISDPKGKLAIDFGVYGTPETFVIGKKGRIRYRQVGPISPRIWKERLLPLLKTLNKEHV